LSPFGPRAAIPSRCPCTFIDGQTGCKGTDCFFAVLYTASPPAVEDSCGEEQPLADNLLQKQQKQQKNSAGTFVSQASAGEPAQGLGSRACVGNPTHAIATPQIYCQIVQYGLY
jgi:hypothetical protein